MNVVRLHTQWVTDIYFIPFPYKVLLSWRMRLLLSIPGAGVWGQCVQPGIITPPLASGGELPVRRGVGVLLMKEKPGEGHGLKEGSCKESCWSSKSIWELRSGRGASASYRRSTMHSLLENSLPGIA